MGLAILSGIAPPLPGKLIEGGRYQQTGQAYLISKLPADEAALQNWIRLYRLQVDKTEDPSLTAQDAQPSRTDFLAGESTQTRERQEEIPGVMGELTRTFLGATKGDSDVQHDAASAEKPGREPLHSGMHNSSRYPSGAFTKEFLSGLDEGPGARGAMPPKVLEPQLSEQANSFTREFLLVNEDNPSPPSDAGILRRGSVQDAALAPPLPTTSRGGHSPSKTGTGEFTEFFRGPFNSRQPSSTPAPSSEPDDLVSHRSERGEFTKVFGSGRAEAPPEADAIDRLAERPEQREPRTLTRLFESQESPAPKNESMIQPPLRARETASQDPEREIRWDLSSPNLRAPVRENVSSLPTPESAATPRVERTLPEPSFKSAGATQVFTPPGSRPISEPPPIATGPSEYTRIISRQPPPPELSQPDPVASAPPNPGSIQAPQAFVPPAPVVPQPRIPVVPPVQPSQFSPPVQYPQMPDPAMPPPTVPWPPNSGMPPHVPPAPKPGPPPAQRVSYWPLIIALNILFVAAVVLVLYFVLKR